MRNLAIILAVAVLAVYAFIAVNEKQKEHVIRMRLPKFRKINKYEFDKALYQIREVRTRKTYEAPKESVQKDQETDTRNDFYKDYDYIENLKSAPSTEAQPVQEPSNDYYPQQPEEQAPVQQVQQQGANQQQGVQTQGQEGAVQQVQPDQQQPEQQAPPAKPVRQMYKNVPLFNQDQQQ